MEINLKAILKCNSKSFFPVVSQLFANDVNQQQADEMNFSLTSNGFIVQLMFFFCFKQIKNLSDFPPKR